MSGIEDFRASREARLEATRPGRHYDPAAYLANQRIRESMILESVAREKAQRKAAAQRAAQQPRTGRAVSKSYPAEATNQGRPEPARSERDARTHVPTDDQPTKRHWYSLRRWGHA